MTHNKTSRSTRGAWLVLTLLVIAGCQAAVDPLTETPRNIRVRTITNTDKPVEGAKITFFADPEHTQQVGNSQETGPNGIALIQVPIPVFGHTYSITAEKGIGPEGAPAYQRTKEVFLQCEDADLDFIFDDREQDTLIVSECDDWNSRLIRIFACPDTRTRREIRVINQCDAPRTYTLPAAPPAPFSIDISGGVSGGSITLQPGQEFSLAIVYDATGQARATSTQLMLASSDAASGSISITVNGTPRKDCDQAAEILTCDALTDLTKTVDFGTICQNTLEGPSCVRFVNTSQEPVRITNATLAAPFLLEMRDQTGARITGTSATVSPGAAINLCVSVQDATVGAKTVTQSIGLECDAGSKATLTLTARATVEFCDTCDCSAQLPVRREMTERIEVGQSGTEEFVIYTNENNCDVRVTAVAPQNPEWQMLPMRIDTTLSKGGELRAAFRYKPTNATAGNDYEVAIDARLISTGVDCNTTAVIEGKACNTDCFEVTEFPEPILDAGAIDTVWVQENGNERFQVSTPGFTNSNTACFTIENPDTACADLNVTFTLDQGSEQEFTIEPPGGLSVPPGETADLCVRFTAPRIEQVRQHGRLDYHAALRFHSGGQCLEQYKVKALLDTFQHCKVDRKLTMYSQSSLAQQRPLYEVYEFASNNVHSLVDPNGADEPTKFDIFHVSKDRLKIVGGGPDRGMFNLSNFAGSEPMFLEFCNRAESIIKKYKPGLPGHGYTSELDVQQGDVVAVKLGGGRYALLFITVAEVDPDANQLDYVHFVVLHPLFP